MTARRTIPAACLLALAALLNAGPFSSTRVAAQGAAVDPVLYNGMQWRSVGPARGGRSIAVGGSEARPNEYWFGAVGGGAWKTTDGGTTWAPMTDGKITMSSVGALGVCQSNPDIVYIGGGEVAFRGNIIQGDGVYRTADGGKTWSHLGLKDSQAIARLRVHPTNCDTVYAAVLGQTYNDHPERGVFKSTDGGATWKKTLFRDEKSGAVDLTIDAKNPNVLLASTWEASRTPWSMSSGGPGSGLFKSTDAGDTWTEITKNPGLPAGLWGKVGVTISPVDGNRAWALIENDVEGGLYMTDDAGATWTKVSDDRNIRQRAFYYTRLVADTQEKDTVYLLNVQFYRSTDAGKTLTRIRVPHGDNHDLWISMTDNTRMIQSNDGSANVTVNRGQTWTGQDVPTGQFYNVFTTKHVPYHICGAQQDNSTACVGSQSQGGAGEGSLPPIFYAVGGGESGYIAPDPSDLNVFYAGSYGGYLTRLDRETGQQRAVNIYPNNPMGYSAIDIKERFQWTFPIVFAPTDPTVLYASSQHLWRTTTGGQNWEKISPNLTRSDPKTMQASGGPITKDQTGVETYAVIFTVAPSHQDGATIWTGSDDGWAHVTRDGAKTWQKVTPPDLPEFARISLIEASPHQNGVAYLAANRYQLGDRRPYLYKTADFGQTWTTITAGIPENDFLRVVREDPTRRGLLYAGTEHGVYVSFNDGAAWQPLQLNLPDTPVHGIVVEERDLVIGTHGRGFYVLDNIGVLRQATPGITSAVLHVFDTFTPLRGRDRNVTIDYYLGKAAEDVKIEFLDGSGAVQRTFTGTPKDDPNAGLPPGMDPETAAFFGLRPVRVGIAQGMNRFTWDMRYEGSVVFPGMIMWAAQPQRGPAASPGQYSARITANGETKTMAFEIGLDPRLESDGITVADLREQFALSTKIRDKVTEANQAVITIRSLRDQVNERLQKIPPRRKAEIQKLADNVLTALATVEAEVYQVKNKSSQDPLNYPIMLNNKIAALAGVVESADHKPTAQSYEVFTELGEALDAQLGAMKKTLDSELPRLNNALRREKLAPVDPAAKAGPPAPPPGARPEA
ncbi:MAG: glycosyl hydrolase [Acidobacteria bacterium]|nr:glycosyl hydrolase [Acidobacteriota bacterium]